MIALIAAVPLETTLLRQALSPCEVRSCGRFELYRGTLEGQPVVLLHCGVGKANAAAATAILLETHRPEAVINFGCGGAYPGSKLEVGDLALASEERYGDEGVDTPAGFLDLEAIDLPLVRHNGQRLFNRFPVASTLLDRARTLFEDPLIRSSPGFAVGPFVTVSTCSGSNRAAAILRQRTGGLCENMEGCAIAQLCYRYNVPFLELRGISNHAENRDLARWDLSGGAATAQQAVRALLGRWHVQKEPA
jgi:futalosine hydrolase